MLEKIDFNTPKLSKEEYKETYDELIKKLIVLQQKAVEEGTGLVVLLEGWNGAGKGTFLSELMYNLDARATHVYVSPDIDAKAMKDFAGIKNGVHDFHPFMQEYWENLGERGHITFFDRGWYAKAAQMRVAGIDDTDFIDSIQWFERQLAADGYIVVKLFFHVRKKTQIKRLSKLYEDKETRWRCPEKKLYSAKDYDDSYEAYDNLLEATDYAFAPWTVLNGEDRRATKIAIAKALVDSLEKGMSEKRYNQATLAGAQAKKDMIEADMLEKSTLEDEATAAKRHPLITRESEAKAAAQHAFAPRKSSFKICRDYPRVDDIRTDLVLEEDYKTELKKLQKELFRLENIMFQRRIPLIIMYEGWDAAGKGGNIKRVAQALDARAYTIVPSPAPTKPELAHPHLWRYWTKVPKAGHVGMFDRSWYGRVLVERVEDITPPERWAQGYDEINEFEHDLVEWGAILLKFWVNISPEEQLTRFEARQQDPNKQWKLTDEDWRNREKYAQYKSAIDDMFRLTSTEFAPWIVLESDDKKYARIKALRIIVDALRERLGVK